MPGYAIMVDELLTCDICHNTQAQFDGKTVHGPWANMCGKCFQAYGVGLGSGRGQRLVRKHGLPKPEGGK